MYCPNCQNKISAWYLLNLNQKENIKEGFHCSTCQTFLVTENLSKNKNNKKIIISVIAIFFYLIIFVGNKFINTDTSYSFAIGFSVFAIAMLFLSLYVNFNYFVKLKIKEQLVQASHAQKNIVEKSIKVSKPSFKRLIVITLCLIVVAGIVLYRIGNFNIYGFIWVFGFAFFIYLIYSIIIKNLK